MGSGEENLRESMLAALIWQIEFGADEAISDDPQDRFAASESVAAGQKPAAAVPAAKPSAPPTRLPAAPRSETKPEASPSPEAAADPTALAGAATNLAELAEAMQSWDGSALKASARNFVFADGRPGARVMVIGEAPGAEEDRLGKPFVGRAGQLLDRMLSAIGLARDAPDLERAVYIANILPWRPPGNRTPSEDEVVQFLPFIERHIALADPEFIFSVGNTPTKSLLGTTSGIKRMRGTWRRHAVSGLPLMPSFHPAYLLRQPADKRLSWADLQQVRAALDGASVP